MRFDTRLVHGGAPRPGPHGDVVAPVHLSSTFDRDAQDEPRWFYSRGENPTREELEGCLAALEDAAGALAFTSGQAAAAAVLSLIPAGRPVLAERDVYGGTTDLLAEIAGRGTPVRRADLTDPAEVIAALAARPAPALVWLETPTNPLLGIVDIAGVVAAARRVGALVAVDNTLAGPVLQQPLALGCDLTVQSTAKSVAGHLDVLGGAVTTRHAELLTRLHRHRTVHGSAPGAQDCYLVLRGLRTLALRVRRQSDSARVLAHRLAEHPAVDEVLHPDLPGHPGHAVARRQMAAGGPVLGFRTAAGDRLLPELDLVANAVSLGGVRSLATVPAFTTHRGDPDAAGRGIGPGLIRLSVGIEDPVDLAEDLEAALARCAPARPTARDRS